MSVESVVCGILSGSPGACDRSPRSSWREFPYLALISGPCAEVFALLLGKGLLALLLLLLLPSLERFAAGPAERRGWPFCASCHPTTRLLARKKGLMQLSLALATVFLVRKHAAVTPLAGSCFSNSFCMPVVSTVERMLPRVWYTNTKGLVEKRSRSLLAKRCLWAAECEAIPS